MNPEYDLAGKVIGLAMKVHRTLGSGFLEGVYKKALQHEVLKDGLSAEIEVPIQVFYEGVVVGSYFADLVVSQVLIVETKAAASLSPANEVQLVNYLTATGKNGGLLLNFGAQSLEFKKKFRVYKARNPEDVTLNEPSQNSPNSVNFVNPV